jgi:hypothetical protein
MHFPYLHEHFHTLQIYLKKTIIVVKHFNLLTFSLDVP